MAISSTASTPSRKRMLNEYVNASSGAPTPALDRERCALSRPLRMPRTSSSSFDTGSPPLMSLRSVAYWNSRSSVRFGFLRRSGTSANSKWSR
jgi:hypothetical protein